MRYGGAFLLTALLLAGGSPLVAAEKPRHEYRVVYSPLKDLAGRLEAAGREGYACA